MKKLITILIAGLFTLASYGQSGVLRGPGGLWIGNATNLTPVFKIGVTPITTTAAQFNYLNTATSNVQTQLDDDVDLSIAVPDSSRTHRVLSKNVKVSHTGDTNEATVYTGTIPANSIGVDGSFHITGLWSATNNAGVKTINVKFNGVIIAYIAMANGAVMRTNTTIWNRHSLSAQAAGNTAVSNLTFGTMSGVALATYTFNTGANITVTVTVTNASSGDTSSVEAFEIIAVN